MRLVRRANRLQSWSGSVLSMIRVLALGLTVLTGFSALVYEVTWQKYLATLLGSHSEATAAVLGIFLGGLAAGYALFGRATRTWLARARARSAPPRLLLVYGFVEAAIGAYALLFPLLFGAAQALSLRLPLGSSGLGFGLDVLLSALLIGPPAVLMGGTIPILTQALARDIQDATRVHALVYGFNTAGAFARRAGGRLLDRAGPRARRRARRHGLPQSLCRRCLPRPRAPAHAAHGRARSRHRDRAGRRARLCHLLHRRPARGLRHDGCADRRDPRRRSLLRRLPVHLLDGRGGLRALHRPREPRGLGPDPHSPGAARHNPVGPRRHPRPALSPDARRSLLGPSAAPALSPGPGRLRPLPPRRLRGRLARDRSPGAALRRHAAADL